jgi:hypothetical protein
MRSLLRELVTRFPYFELAGMPQRMVTVLRNGWHTAPMLFHAARLTNQTGYGLATPCQGPDRAIYFNVDVYFMNSQV